MYYLLRSFFDWSDIETIVIVRTKNDIGSQNVKDKNFSPSYYRIGFQFNALSKKKQVNQIENILSNKS